MSVGSLRITGSMGDAHFDFSANEHGHAHAINEAMIFLTGLMQRAINTDHDVRDSNEPAPTQGWHKGPATHKGPGKI